MRRLIFFIILTSTTLLGQTAMPIVYSIPIQNPSFETPIPIQSPPNTCGYQMFGVPGWLGSTSVLIPLDMTNVESTCGFATPPDGKSVLWVTYGNPVSQDLGDIYTLLPHNHNGLDVVGILKLKVYVANRFYWYDGAYTVSLSLRENSIPNYAPPTPGILCSTSGIARGDFTEIPLVCPEQRQYGELWLNLSADTPDWSILADKVSLTFTPTN